MNFSDQLMRSQAATLSLDELSLTERTQQAIEKLKEELTDKLKLLDLLEKHPEVEEILRLMTKPYGNMY